jgi:hypothetical protein
LPGVPVKISATWKGWERNFWTLRARNDDELVLVGEFVHAQDRDDVLEVLVALQDALHAAGDAVVARRRRPRERARVEVEVERVDGRVDAELGDASARARWWRRGGRRWWPEPGRSGRRRARRRPGRT